MKIVVVGGGSVGAHVAYRLAVEGADVTLIEATAPAAGTSSASFAWLSSFPQMSWKEDPGRATLRRGVHERFHRLQDELGGQWMHWTGTLTWGTPDERASLRAAVDACRAAGAELALLDAAASRRAVPGLVLDDADELVWEADGGWVDAPALVELLLQGVRDHGGTVLVGHPVVAITTTDDGADDGGRRVTGVVLDDASTVEADAVVDAAGSWGSHVAALAGLAIPLDLVPGLMVYTEPVPGLPTQVLNAPTWLTRPDPSGGLAIHWRGEPMSSIHGANGWSAQRIVDDVARTIPALRDTAPVRSRVGIRPIPPGGPVVGALPWLDGFYLTLSHGGIGWGPVWAEAVARELLHGDTMAELDGMRPDRFFLGRDARGRFADDAEQAAVR